jgi:hypothetical protein
MDTAVTINLKTVRAHPVGHIIPGISLFQENC